MSSNLVDVLTLRSIQKLADTGTLARGTAYFHDGAVGLLDADECEVRASVQGTQRYRVRLAAGSLHSLRVGADLGYESHAGGDQAHREEGLYSGVAE